MATKINITSISTLDFQLLVVSNKGLMKIRSGIALEETTIIVKPLTVQDLLRKHNGARKLQQYFEEARIGYINAEGKRRINKSVFEEINHAVCVMKTEKVSQRAPVITEIEAMDEEEFDQFQEIVSKMITTILQVKKPEQAAQTKLNLSSVILAQEYIREVELQLSKVITKLLKKFSEAVHKEEARKEEAYKNRIIKEIQLCEQIKAQSLKKWELLMARLKVDLLTYAQKDLSIERQKLDFALLHPKNILGNVASPVV